MGEFIQNVQVRLKSTSAGFMVVFFRMVTGLFVGMCFSLIGQEALGYGSFAFWFVIITFAAAFMRISRRWKAFGVFLFNLLFILIGMLLKMYITVAPGR